MILEGLMWALASPAITSAQVDIASILSQGGRKEGFCTMPPVILSTLLSQVKHLYRSRLQPDGRRKNRWRSLGPSMPCLPD